jgi:hypothetical protein
MQLEDIILREVTHVQKDKCHMFSLIWESQIFLRHEYRRGIIWGRRDQWKEEGIQERVIGDEYD